MCKQLLYLLTGILQFLVRLFCSKLCIPGKSSGRGALRKLCQHQNPSNILRPIERNPSSFTGVGKDFCFLLSSLVSSSKHLNKTYVKNCLLKYLLPASTVFHCCLSFAKFYFSTCPGMERMVTVTKFSLVNYS